MIQKNHLFNTNDFPVISNCQKNMEVVKVNDILYFIYKNIIV